MAASSPSAHATIGAPESWAAPFGAPGRAERDPGTHFTATSVTKLCDPWDLRWNRHLAYSPTVAGYIGRANGSLTRKRIRTDRKARKFSTGPGCSLLLQSQRDRLEKGSPQKMLDTLLTYLLSF